MKGYFVLCTIGRSQKTVSTTFDAPELYLVHTAVNQLENFVSYKYF